MGDHMLISIEGISCVGKTTLVSHLSQTIENAKHLGRHSSHRSTYLALRKKLTNDPISEIELQYQYIPLVKSKIDLIKATHTSNLNSTIITDRDFWSFYVHGLAKFKYTYQSHTKEFSALFDQIVNLKPQIANLTVILQISYDQWLIRANQRKGDNIPHPDLFNLNFYHALQKSYFEVYQILEASHQPVLYFDQAESIENLTNLIVQKIQEIEGIDQSLPSNVFDEVTFKMVLEHLQKEQDF
jgi:thymidylate kinase